MAHTIVEEKNGENVGEIATDDRENSLIEEEEDDADDKLACILDEEEYEQNSEDCEGNNEANHKIATKEGKQHEGDGLCKDESMGVDVMGHDNNEGNAKEKNNDKVEENSKQKLIKLRGTNNLMKMAKVASEGERKKLSKENASNCKDKLGPKELASKGRARQETKKVAGENMLQIKKKASEGKENLASKKAASRGKDVAGSSCRMRSSKKAEMGMIFMCNSETKKDCYHYNVLGLPANKRELVQNVYKGMVLFLYDVDLKLMYGIYKAAGPGGYNIEPNAFKSQFPSQVRFRVLDDCKPLAEENFRKTIQKNYYTRTKFDCKLTSEQVKDLCKLFTAASRRSPFKLGRHIKVDSNRVVQKDSIGKHGVGCNKKRPAVEEHRYHGQHSHGYKRDEVPFRQARVYHFPRLTQPAAAHSYAHERNPATDTYRRRPLAKAHDDSFRHDRLEESWDNYEQDVLLDQHHYYRQEPVLESHASYRRDGMMDHDDLRPLDLSPRWDDEIRNRRSYDLYASYHECPSYCDPDYRMIPPERLSAEYSPVYHSPKYHSTSGPLPEYHNADLMPEYRVSAGLYRYRH